MTTREGTGTPAVQEERARRTAARQKVAVSTTMICKCVSGHEWFTEGFVYTGLQQVSITTGKCPICGDPVKVIDYGSLNNG